MVPVSKLDAHLQKPLPHFCYKWSSRRHNCSSGRQKPHSGRSTSKAAQRVGEYKPSPLCKKPSASSKETFRFWSRCAANVCSEWCSKGWHRILYNWYELVLKWSFHWSESCAATYVLRAWNTLWESCITKTVLWCPVWLLPIYCWINLPTPAINLVTNRVLCTVFCTQLTYIYPMGAW